MDIEDKISSIKLVIEEQLEVCKICLWLSGHGPLKYEGEMIDCSLAPVKRVASVPIVLAAGQSAHTILDSTEKDGNFVRDLYSIVRCSLEAWINAAYIIVEKEDVAERAIRHVEFASYKRFNRNVGTGPFSMRIGTSHDIPDILKQRFKEFMEKGKGNWTHLDTHSRINRVGKLGGGVAGGRLLGGYALIYSISSEIIHGSLYGAHHFFSGYMKEFGSVENYLINTRSQLFEILLALTHGIGGYMSAFFYVHKFKELLEKEEEIFQKVMTIVRANQGEKAFPE